MLKRLDKVLGPATKNLFVLTQAIEEFWIANHFGIEPRLAKENSEIAVSQKEVFCWISLAKRLITSKEGPCGNARSPLSLRIHKLLPDDSSLPVEFRVNRQIDWLLSLSWKPLAYSTRSLGNGDKPCSYWPRYLQ